MLVYLTNMGQIQYKYIPNTPAVVHNSMVKNCKNIVAQKVK